MELPDEQLLVTQAQAGDRESFASLVHGYWERIRRWLTLMTSRTHLAEDLTQETFVKVWTSLGQLKSPAGFRSWLYRIARNLAIDAAKGDRGRPTQVLSESLAANTNEPPIKLIEAEAFQRLREAIAQLPSPYREAYLLWTNERFAYSEIAAVLGSTEEMARWRVCKARQMLLAELGPYLERT